MYQLTTYCLYVYVYIDSRSAVYLKEPSVEESLNLLKQSQKLKQANKRGGRHADKSAENKPQVISKATASLVEESVRRAARTAREALQQRRRDRKQQRVHGATAVKDPHRVLMGASSSAEGEDTALKQVRGSTLDILSVYADKRLVESPVVNQQAFSINRGPGSSGRTSRTSSRMSTTSGATENDEQDSEEDLGLINDEDQAGAVTSRAIFKQLREAGLTLKLSLSLFSSSLPTYIYIYI